MKQVILSLVLTTLLSAGFFAQNSVEKADVNIRALVLQQIENAQKNMQNSAKNEDSEKEEAALQTERPVPGIVAPQNTNDVNDEELAAIATFLENTKKNIWTKLTKLPPFKRRLLPYFLLIELFLLGTILATYLISRRSVKTKKSVKTYNLKETVRKMREEKLGSKANPEISKLRSELSNANDIRINDGGEVIRFAKRRGISKGEVLLALKVKILSSKHG
jgi:cell division protein FtsB